MTTSKLMSVITFIISLSLFIFVASASATEDINHLNTVKQLEKYQAETLILQAQAEKAAALKKIQQTGVDLETKKVSTPIITPNVERIFSQKGELWVELTNIPDSKTVFHAGDVIPSLHKRILSITTNKIILVNEQHQQSELRF